MTVLFLKLVSGSNNLRINSSLELLVSNTQTGFKQGRYTREKNTTLI